MSTCLDYPDVNGGEMKGETKVSYRLDYPYSDKLAEDARKHRMSANLYARLILVQHYESAQLLEVLDGVERIETQVRGFRSAFDAALE